MLATTMSNCPQWIGRVLEAGATPLASALLPADHRLRVDVDADHLARTRVWPAAMARMPEPQP
jgi:hypothetical protein